MLSNNRVFGYLISLWEIRGGRLAKQWVYMTTRAWRLGPVSGGSHAHAKSIRKRAPMAGACYGRRWKERKNVATTTSATEWTPAKS